MKHSKGPWEYIPSVGEDLPRVLSAHVTEYGNFYIASCNVDADAMLIAAAPDLLEALIKLRLEAQHYKQTGGKGVQFLDGALNQAIEAIAKAQGETK